MEEVREYVKSIVKISSSSAVSPVIASTDEVPRIGWADEAYPAHFTYANKTDATLEDMMY